MFLNYLKTALRNMARRKGYTFINITGLALGMACCILIMMYVNFELSYDRYNEKGDRIYRVICTIPYEGKLDNYASVSAPLAKILLKEFSEIENAVRFYISYNARISHDNGYNIESKIIFTDPSLFDIFSIPLLIGNPKSALNAPNSIIISRKVMQKYFGNQNPIGKTLKIDNNSYYTVTAVFENMPNNSHFITDIFASFTSLNISFEENLLRIKFPTYILLKKGTNYKILEKRFSFLIEKYVYPYFVKNKEKFIYPHLVKKKENLSYFVLNENSVKKIEYYLQPLYSIYLNSGDLKNNLASEEEKTYITFLVTIAFFILIIASINFINLSTAQSSIRAKEVGIRNVSGAFRYQLIGQHLLESMILSIFSVVIALGLADIIVPYFSTVLQKSFTSADIMKGNMIPLVFIITLFTGLISGLYPSLFLTSSRFICFFKNRMTFGIKSKFVRRGLVIFQFTSSLILIICTIVVIAQLNYFGTTKLGFDKEHILILKNASLLGNRAHEFKNNILKNPNFLIASISNFLPVPSSKTIYFFNFEKNEKNKNTPMLKAWIGHVDKDFLKTLGIKLTEGINFTANDTIQNEVIINKQVANTLGWKSIDNKKLRLPTSSTIYSISIKGMVEDFHFDSLKSYIFPVVFFPTQKGDYILCRIESKNIPEILKFLQNKWNQYLPGQPFEYEFLDKAYYAQYENEQRIAKILGAFAFLAIFIACLGLFGLVTFVAEQRTKEIGIRKVLGASVSSIVQLLCKEFLILVGIANLIAWPIAYAIMNRWLNTFAYHVSFSPWIFIAAGLISLVIAFLTVSYRAIKTALADPVKSLRYE